jgi:hypothetical protein
MADQQDEAFEENNYWNINDPELPVFERQDAIRIEDDMIVMTDEEIRQARQRLIAEEEPVEEAEKETPAYELKFVD